MIKAKMIYSVVCDECGATLDANAGSARIARETADKAGWKTYILHFSEEKHYCPKCKHNHISWNPYYGG